MARKANFCVLGACIALAACGGGSGGSGGTTGPGGLIGELDATPPFGVSTGFNVPMLSATVDGLSEIDATIRFDADGSFTLTLPDATTVRLTDADKTSDTPFFDSHLLTFRTNYRGGGNIVDVHLGDDAAGQDLFQYVWVQKSGVGHQRFSHLVFGNDTETLPGGTASFAGGFRAQGLATTGRHDMEGSSDIDVDFASGNVIVVLEDSRGADSFQFTGTGTISPGTSRYSGTIATSGGPSDFSGTFNGGFFGAGAEGTAGTFHATDTSTQTMIGVFTGYRPSP